MSYWREKAALAIADAIAFTKVNLENLSEQDKQQLKCAIDAAYPFGSRKNHPYQVWLDELLENLMVIFPKKDGSLVDNAYLKGNQMNLSNNNISPEQKAVLCWGWVSHVR